MKPVKNVTSATVIAAASGVPHAGQLIGDRYRLDRPLERGAMGSVWRAEQVRLRAPVAVKFLDPSLIGDREMHDRFIQEARSAAAVRSAHVVQVFDYGSEEGVPYIAMELLDGENLDARLGARGTLTPAELDRLVTELARGIGQAHAIGVIQRDLKLTTMILRMANSALFSPPKPIASLHHAILTIGLRRCRDFIVADDDGGRGAGIHDRVERFAGQDEAGA